MLFIIIFLLLLVLALTAAFLLIADGDFTLMCTERFGRKPGECICIL